MAIGASAGGVSALQKLVSQFDEKWPVAVFITIHMGRGGGDFARILNGKSPMPVSYARHGGEFGRGIYLAPPDRHLIIGKNGLSLSEGPRENYARPAIDPMFRSAAQNHGCRVIGVLLTGYLYDGVSGLYDIHAAGGRTIIQHPTDAEVPDIPLNALRRFSPDYLIPLSKISTTIAQELQVAE